MTPMHIARPARLAVLASLAALAGCTATTTGTPSTGVDAAGVAAAPLPGAPLPAASPERLLADVTALVGFGTRHTASSVTDPRRGIGAARDWAAATLEGIARDCGGCLEVTRIADTVTGPRAPGGVRVENVLAIQRGTGDPADVVIIAGHIDSRASDVMDAAIDAPGANDNASGTALVIEAARILSRQHHRATIVYAILSGEEQGLWGGRILAAHAKERGWRVLAWQNNDIVGGSQGTEGQRVTDRIRVFSEGIRISEDLPGQLARRGTGGEDDGPSRALAKAARETADAMRAARADRPSLLLVRRPDRFQRGGDHLPALDAGLPAVRFSVGIEDYDSQHQDVRVEGGRRYGDTIDQMDFAYLARVTDLNAALARRLANAPAAPARVVIEGAVSSHTTVRWDAVPGAAAYVVRWRRTDTDRWTDARRLPATATQARLDDVVIDDHFFGVSALDARGNASLVTFAGPAPRP